MTTATELTKEGMPLEEFLRRQDEQPFELIEGEIIPVSPSFSISGEILRRLTVLLTLYAEKTQQILVYTDTTFVLSAPTDKQWVTGSRIPDMMIYSDARMTAYWDENPDWDSQPFHILPDQVIEVMSLTDRLPDVLYKVSLYLNDGIPVVWVVDPGHKTVTVYTQTIQQIFSQDQVLEGGELLPGLSISLKQLFAKKRK
jgi:Uma2 family endonuclease